MSLPGVISHRIRIRYRSGVTPVCRILFKTRYFNIVSVINIDEKKEFLELICKEDI
jgi:SPP1 family predicted phage head-tail adaptor